MPKNLECPVEVADHLQIGDYANAVRVMRDGSETLLDFLVYSESEGRAAVVARLRVKPEFLVALRERIEESLSLNTNS